ncbi:hypothetical protein KIN38_17230 [Vibrio sp. B511a]|uniref:hypothetical protein n=1 Tax=Vibrio sp. B511a TaxID=2835905 RepID=UPI002552580C|nr:hypothetical protein [Vibrio sp. B511a]MDK9734472.1 hypothetical protein [Vibrio sp. B511a]
MEHIKIIIKFFRYDLKNTITILIYSLFLLSLFVFAPRAHAVDTDRHLVVSMYPSFSSSYCNQFPDDRCYFSLEHSIESMYRHYADANPTQPKYEKPGAYSWFENNNILSVYADNSVTNHKYDMDEGTPYWNHYNSHLWLSPVYTVSDCLAAGMNVQEIPSGYVFEGEYVCRIDDAGQNPDQPSDGIYTPEKFDEFFCGQPQIKDKLTYAYYPFSSAIDYRVRRALGSSAVLGGDPNDETLNIYICGSDGCSYEQLLEDARKVISFLPEERFFAKESQYGGYYDFEVFAYCKSAVKQISISDLTSDTTVDCRKAIYQYTGESGASLTSPPDSFCYEDNEHDYSFKQWCEGQFSQDSYWLEGQLEEYCDPPAKTTSEEKVETSDTCEITTEIIDVAYNTDETRNDITKNIQKKIITKDCEGNVLDETVVDGSITIDKSEILGDGSSDSSERECVVGPYCPPNNGTSEGTGTGKGESEAGSSTGDNWGSVSDPDLEGWYESKYPDGFSGVINKNLELYNTGAFSDFLNSLNPFQDTGSFPILELDFDFGEVANFGRHSIDLESIPVSPTKTINLIALLKALLLIYASFYAFRQVL